MAMLIFKSFVVQILGKGLGFRALGNTEINSQISKAGANVV